MRTAALVLEVVFLLSFTFQQRRGKKEKVNGTWPRLQGRPLHRQQRSGSRYREVHHLLAILLPPPRSQRFLPDDVNMNVVIGQNANSCKRRGCHSVSIDITVFVSFAQFVTGIPNERETA